MCIPLRSILTDRTQRKRAAAQRRVMQCLIWKLKASGTEGKLGSGLHTPAQQRADDDTDGMILTQADLRG